MCGVDRRYISLADSRLSFYFLFFFSFCSLHTELKGVSGGSPRSCTRFTHIPEPPSCPLDTSLRLHRFSPLSARVTRSSHSINGKWVSVGRGGEEYTFHDMPNQSLMRLRSWYEAITQLIAMKKKKKAEEKEGRKKMKRSKKQIHTQSNCATTMLPRALFSL